MDGYGASRGTARKGRSVTAAGGAMTGSGVAQSGHAATVIDGLSHRAPQAPIGRAKCLTP
ncbi:hypothetical protein ATSB10_12100 [Dyella thiooxydans]|uniref:Uncharacterized protein n=1 Tax=Dyella thiooxydans TaxID=445710 RepID=A0A160MZS6_9GAMM|nr:hypothetical protein ATSB10_12100 [Dyella thiooxydans]